MTVKEVFKKNNDDKLLEAAYSLGLLDYENEQHEVCRRCMLQIARRCRKATNLSNAHKKNNSGLGILDNRYDLD